MASTGVNVGPPTQLVPINGQRAEHAKHEYESKQKLIDQAKAEYAKKHAPAPSATPKDEVITDANHPNFDLEKLLLKLAKENP
ncbi:hypothetical protein UVI_02049370 [Ustilaginoidea virens]|uniref:ATP synthase F(0) complex subunit e, mitochondrial n=1 Tax=Ustilaginoidea virens TaxID=1159556 RepID=A0A1B5L2Z6_USTVR|nr:hypothetical protein UVI_02049370 [Ustilaginoidea virens]